MAEPGRQLALAFPHRPLFIEAGFLPSDANRLALDFLAKPADWPHRRLAALGHRGGGKTHLLHIWARAQRAPVLPAAELTELHWPDRPLALDDIEQAPSEPVLLHLLNAAEQAGQPVLLAAAEPPARLRVALPDLASRLRATTAVEVGAADEAFLSGLLARLLAERQMQVTPATQSWLLRRLPRTPGAVQDAVARLDHAALAAGGAVGRTLATRVLTELFHDNPPADPQLGLPARNFIARKDA